MRFFALLLVVASLVGAETRTIPNPMRQGWPHELVSMDFPIEALASFGVVNGMGDARPVQWEKASRDGKEVARAWFIATVLGELKTDKKGKTKRDKPPVSLDVTFVEGSAPSVLSLREEGDWWLIDNGIAQFRIHRYAGSESGQCLQDISHWLGGMRLGSEGVFDGKAWFEGSAALEAVDAKVVHQGPVFIDLHITYRFAEAETNGSVDALVLEASKRTHFDHAGIQRRETIPALDRHYEVLLRFVVGDPWVEVVERYHLPEDKTVPSYGNAQYWIRWGEAEGVPWDRVPMAENEFEPLDTTFWMRWFEYDQFGGNDRVQTLPAKPRAAQKGRPFALLRPRWNQGGGGAQDFFLTRGGTAPISVNEEHKRLDRQIQDREKRAARNEEKAKALDKSSAEPDLDDETKQAQLTEKGTLRAEARKLLINLDDAKAQLKAASKIKDITERKSKNREVAGLLDITLPGGPDYDPTHPSFGVVAAYPSKWVGPYQATIPAYVRPKAFGVRVPLRSGGGGGGNDGDTDNNWYGQRCYALVVGPRSRFDSTGKMDNLVRNHTDWTLTALINKYVLKWERDPQALGPHILMSRERLMQLRADLKAEKDTPEVAALQALIPEYEKLRGELNRLKGLEKKERDAARNEIKALEKQLNGKDFPMLALIKGDSLRIPRGPNVSRYFKRYQDDSVNPTNYGNRRMVNGPFPPSDLFTTTKPYGGATEAAIGYIYTDLDAWPGWQNGWGPGNPNFHTDKYLASLFAAASLPDHPHAKEWLEFGRRNMEEDLAKVILPPHGVGWECPGYSGFSMHLQLEIARVFANGGYENPLVANPLVKGNGRWHRKLITPYNFRINRRHEAPIGDTHRWDSGMGGSFLEIAPFYKDSDPDFAAEMAGTYKLLKDSGAGMKTTKTLKGLLTKTDSSIVPMDPADMDWSSEYFHGFGAILRTGFGTEQETFLTLRAGFTMGHYHNEALSYHYYADGTPISMDYNCSYHPRGDHSGLHNTMTFGEIGQVKNNTRGVNVEAMEQIFGAGRMGAFASGKLADVTVSERSGSTLSMSPVEPHDAEFQRSYPSRKVDRIVHRRFLAMVKHDADSALSDYLVVRDETRSSEAQQVNIHMLSRSMEVDGNSFHFVGQHDKDMIVHVAAAKELSHSLRQWHYYDEWMNSPGVEYQWQPGESQDEWAARMEALKASKGWDAIPGPDWKPQWRKGGKGGVDPDNDAWRKFIHDSHGKALIPPPGWSEEASWMYGEYQQWLRLESKPGTPVLWVLYPYERGAETPTFETIADGRGVRVTLGGESEEIILATDSDGLSGQAVIRRGGVEEVLVQGDQVPALGEIKDVPLD